MVTLGAYTKSLNTLQQVKCTFCIVNTSMQKQQHYFTVSMSENQPYFKASNYAIYVLPRFEAKIGIESVDQLQIEHSDKQAKKLYI